jgi:hypothetical protein
MNAIFPLIVFAVANPPALVCSDPVAAKGDLKAGPPLAHAFQLANRSADTITITKVQAGCGCVKRSLSAKVLKPGETATLTLDVNTLTQPDGPNRWQAVVAYTSNGASGELVTALTANLSRDVTLTPPQLGFSTAGEAMQQIAIADRRSTPLAIVKAASTSPHLSATIGNGVIQVKLAADMPAGQRDELLVLQTNDPAYPEFRVPVRINKKAPGQVQAAPEEVAVKFTAGQEEVSALVQLRAPEGKTVRIESAASDYTAASVKFSTAAGPVATLRVTLGGTAAMQPGSCTITVKLAEPAGQVVLVPVSWRK